MAINNFARHLKDDGVIIVEPWFTPSVFKQGYTHYDCYEDDQLKIARMSHSRKQGRTSIIDFHHLIGYKDKPVQYVKDIMRAGLFTVPETLAAFKKAGLYAKHIDNGDRGLYVARKKQAP